MINLIPDNLYLKLLSLGYNTPLNLNQKTPSYQEIFAWFRHTYGIYVAIIPCKKTLRAEIYTTYHLGPNKMKLFSMYDTLSIHYKSYEEAETQCLETLLTLPAKLNLNNTHVHKSVHENPS